MKKTQFNQTSIDQFESARQDYLKELAKLKVKYSIIFKSIAQGAANEQITAANR